MMIIRPTSRFKKDLKHAIKQGRNLERLKLALEALAAPEPLPPDFKDHKLKGKWHDFRECHIESDLLLIYACNDCELRPTRLGTHAELFE
ncbi:MAG: type II toxin-antitoxin system YafQ family toxin [Desulfatirhabdiaceae bacterium]